MICKAGIILGYLFRRLLMMFKIAIFTTVLALVPFSVAAHRLPGDVSCPHEALPSNMSKVKQGFHTLPQSTRMNLQHVLRHAGLYNGRDDGIWGRKTECAMRAAVSHFAGDGTYFRRFKCAARGTIESITMTPRNQTGASGRGLRFPWWRGVAY